MKSPGPVDILEKYDTEALVQKFLYTGDDRNISKVYVAGRQVKWPYPPATFFTFFMSLC